MISLHDTSPLLFTTSRLPSLCFRSAAGPFAHILDSDARSPAQPAGGPGITHASACGVACLRPPQAWRRERRENSPDETRSPNAVINQVRLCLLAPQDWRRERKCPRPSSMRNRGCTACALQNKGKKPVRVRSARKGTEVSSSGPERLRTRGSLHWLRRNDLRLGMGLPTRNGAADSEWCRRLGVGPPTRSGAAVTSESRSRTPDRRGGASGPDSDGVNSVDPALWPSFGVSR